MSCLNRLTTNKHPYFGEMHCTPILMPVYLLQGDFRREVHVSRRDSDGVA